MKISTPTSTPFGALVLPLFALVLLLAACNKNDETGDGNEAPENGEVNIESSPGDGVSFDGYTYPSVVLGNGQEWMAENLRTSVYRNGDPITYMPVQPEWTILEEGAYCFFNNQAENGERYGKLYNGYVIEDPRNVCPQGWRVPSDEDWNALEAYVGLSEFDLTQWGSRGTNQGEHLKSTRTEPDEHPRFCSPNEATNSTGFNALPTGSRLDNGFGFDMGLLVYYWSSTYHPLATDALWVRSLGCNTGTIGKLGRNKNFGLCIRCIKE